MEEETIIPSDSEVIELAETTVEETPETIAEMTESIEQKPVEKTVPEYAFVAQKKALQKAEQELRQLKEQKGSTTSTSIDAIADKYDIDREFIAELSQTIRAEATAEVESKISSKQAEQNKQQKFEELFNNAFNQAIENAPEFGTIANPSVIKQLALLPQNANKTVLQIVEETYSNAVTGKRTIEVTQPRGGKDPEPLDYKKAENDIEYFKEVMADPDKKAKYNEYMLSKGF